MSISSAYLNTVQTANSAYNKNSIPKYPNKVENSSNIEVIKSGRKVLADDLLNQTKQSANIPKKDASQVTHNQRDLNAQSIKNAIFGKNNSKLLEQIESNLNIENFAKKVKNVNIYVDEMVSNIKEVMDEKGVTQELNAPASYKRFNVTI